MVGADRSRRPRLRSRRRRIRPGRLGDWRAAPPIRPLEIAPSQTGASPLCAPTRAARSPRRAGRESSPSARTQGRLREDSTSWTSKARRPWPGRSTSRDRDCPPSASLSTGSTGRAPERPCGSRATSRRTGSGPGPPGPRKRARRPPGRAGVPSSTRAEAKGRLRAPLAASTAAVELASAADPAACASISRTTASEKSPPLSPLRPGPAHQIAPPTAHPVPGQEHCGPRVSERRRVIWSRTPA